METRRTPRKAAPVSPEKTERPERTPGKSPGKSSEKGTIVLSPRKWKKVPVKIFLEDDVDEDCRVILNGVEKSPEDEAVDCKSRLARYNDDYFLAHSSRTGTSNRTMRNLNLEHLTEAKIRELTQDELKYEREEVLMDFADQNFEKIWDLLK